MRNNQLREMENKCYTVGEDLFLETFFFLKKIERGWDRENDRETALFVQQVIRERYIRWCKLLDERSAAVV